MARTISIVVIFVAAGLATVVGSHAQGPPSKPDPAGGLLPEEETALRRVFLEARDPRVSEEVRRMRLATLGRRIADLRAAGRRPAPLVDLGAWAAIVAPPLSGALPDVRGRLVSKPFEGYHFAIPRSYRPDLAVPLVICLHDTGENGRRFIERYWRVKGAADAIVFAPDWPGRGRVRWSARDRIALTLGVVGDVILQRFNVDRNKIFLDGAGDGGTEAWRLASYFAHLFAGVIARNGFPGPDREGQTVRFGNLRHLRTMYFHVNGRARIPLYPPGQERPIADWLNYENTEAGRAAGKALIDLDAELDNIGHHAAGWALVALDAPLAERSAFMAERIAGFMRGTTRNPYPHPITWHVRDNNARRAYWIRSIDEEYAFELEQPSFEAYVNRDENRLEISSSRIRGLEIQLNDRIVDLGRRLQITVNDKTLYDGTPARSLARLLRSAQRSGDPFDVFPWGIRLEIDTER